MLRQKRSYRYIDDLTQLVDNYDCSPHRSLNYVAPSDVNKEIEADLWAFMYLKKSNRKENTRLQVNKWGFCAY